MSNFKNVLISGASSGLGRALVIELAKSAENLFLCARSLENLQQTKNLCINYKAKIHLKNFDITDSIACENYVNDIEQNYPLDLVIANAGISAGTALGTESHHQITEIFNTNIDGVINLITPAIEKMKSRYQNNKNNKNSCGQIAIISSLAGFIALPSSPAYSASKSAVRIYGEALRVNLAPFGIKVNVICPGYIKTPMTAVNNFYMPFLMEASKASKKIIAGLEQNLPRIIFPKILYGLIMLANALPIYWREKLFALLPKKNSLNIKGE